VCGNDVANKVVAYDKVKDVPEILRGEGLIEHYEKPTGFLDNSVEHIWTVIDFNTFVEDHKKKMQNEYLQERFQHNL